MNNIKMKTEKPQVPLSDVTFSYIHPTGKKVGKLEYDEGTLILKYKGGYITNPELDKLIISSNK